MSVMSPGGLPAAPSSVIPQGVGAPPPPGMDPRKGKLMCIKVRMLDDTVGVFHLGHKANGQALFDEVCRHLNLLESDYFGLEFFDCFGNRCWLDHEKAILRQISQTRSDARFFFVVKFYTQTPEDLEEEYTRYLFALQVKRDLATGQLPCNDNTAALLASFVVQAECGDFGDDDYPDHTYLHAAKFVPKQDAEFEKKVMENHRKHIGMTPAEADMALMETARRCEMYGVKLHPAKDHESLPLYLSVSHVGVKVYQNLTCINVFSWAKMRKISFKKKRFLIKLHTDNYQFYKDTVEFFFETRNECKMFWKKCIEHHGFFRCSDVKSPMKPKPAFFSRGSSFRYSGRTQKQLIEYIREHHKRREPFTRPVHSSFTYGQQHPRRAYSSERSLPTPILPVSAGGSATGRMNGGGGGASSSHYTSGAITSASSADNLTPQERHYQLAAELQQAQSQSNSLPRMPPHRVPGGQQRVTVDSHGGSSGGSRRNEPDGHESAPEMVSGYSDNRPRTAQSSTAIVGSSTHHAPPSYEESSHPHRRSNGDGYGYGTSDSNALPEISGCSSRGGGPESSYSNRQQMTPSKGAVISFHFPMPILEDGGEGNGLGFIEQPLQLASSNDQIILNKNGANKYSSGYGFSSSSIVVAGGGSPSIDQLSEASYNLEDAAAELRPRTHPPQSFSSSEVPLSASALPNATSAYAMSQSRTFGGLVSGDRGVTPPSFTSYQHDTTISLSDIEGSAFTPYSVSLPYGQTPPPCDVEPPPRGPVPSIPPPQIERIVPLKVLRGRAPHLADFKRFASKDSGSSGIFPVLISTSSPGNVNGISPQPILSTFTSPQSVSPARHFISRAIPHQSTSIESCNSGHFVIPPSSSGELINRNDTQAYDNVPVLLRQPINLSSNNQDQAGVSIVQTVSFVGMQSRNLPPKAEIVESSYASQIDNFLIRPVSNNRVPPAVPVKPVGLNAFSKSMVNPKSILVSTPTSPPPPQTSKSEPEIGPGAHSESEATGGTGTVSEGTSERRRRVKTITEKSYFILKELLMTERTYVRELHVLCSHLHSTLSQNTEIDPELYMDIFNALLPLKEFHSSLMVEMEQKLTIWEGKQAATGDHHMRVGNLLLCAVHNGLQVYQHYLSNLAIYMATLDELCRTNKAFELCYTKFEMQKLCYLPITRLLLKPPHRLVHYQLMLARLVNFYLETGANNADISDAKVGLEKLTVINEGAKDSVLSLENFVMLVELERDLVGVDNLVQPNRLFLREGSLQRYTRKGAVHRLFLLFNDCLLYASRAVSTGSQSPKQSQQLLKFKLHGQIPMRGLMLEDGDPLKTGSNMRNCFTIYGGNRSLLVGASSLEEKLIWWDDLTRAISAAKETSSDLPHFSSLKSSGSGNDDATSHVSSSTGGGGHRHHDPMKGVSQENLQHEGLSMTPATPASPGGAMTEQRQMHHRANNSTHVCWHRNTTVSIEDIYRSCKLKSLIQEDIPLASLPLLGYSVGAPVPEDNMTKDYVFKLYYKTHFYFFRSESDYSYHRWMEALRSACVRPPAQGAFGIGATSSSAASV